MPPSRQDPSADASPRTAGGARTLAAKTARAAGVPDSLSAIVEQLINRVIKPFDLVLLSRERIQETLDEAAERGRVTRSDANALVLELVKRGRQQTDDVLSQLESLWGRGRGGLESATRLGRRGAESVPGIPDYDELTARQVIQRIKGLEQAELRDVRDHERRHANRKSVLDAVDRSLERG